ncbi:hypothetical protein C8U37_1189 [Trichococcus patagoniensis]|uniref:Uncharacterized protein n=1 Tax=Trichococcus patagoniensis TaxID=382641 RepID=A0A2T5IEE3_9LACT|nr:hypothetical protein C8U37_1189 [Trichococcus patagoniensis]
MAVGVSLFFFEKFDTSTKALSFDKERTFVYNGWYKEAHDSDDPQNL